MATRKSILWILLTLTASYSRTVAVDPAGAPPPVLLDDMGGSRPTLRLLDAEPSVRILEQTASQRFEPSGAVGERVVLAAPAGASAPLAYAVPAAPVIQELRFEAVATCSRPGVQLAASVVLPRSIDPQTGAPRRLLVRSGQTASSGLWQRLSISGLPILVSQNARVARAKFGAAIDEREAYVSHLVILAPGGRGPTEVWVDQIAVFGVLQRANDAVAPASLQARWEQRAATPAPNSLGSPTLSGAESQYQLPPMPPAPAFPRLVRWNGEPFELLQRIGFDGAWMARTPSRQELASAQRIGFHVVCPPPSVEALSSDSLDGQFNAVMAWDLGAVETEADLNAAEAWKTAVRQWDTRTARPIVLRSRRMLREASRTADVLVLRRPTGGSLSWAEYEQWLSQQRRMLPAGIPAWVEIDVEPCAGARAQLASLSGMSASSVPSANEYCRSVMATLAARPAGICFGSNELISSGGSGRARAMGLELANARLGLMRPWLAAGKLTAASINGGMQSGLVLTAERSHLAVLNLGATGAGSGNNHEQTSIVVPCSPETSSAYLLEGASPEHLKTKRVTGGLQATLGQVGADALVLVTDDTVALNHVERYLRQTASREIRIRAELASMERQTAAGTLSQLPAALSQAVDAPGRLRLVDSHLASVAGGGMDAAAAKRELEAAEAGLAELLHLLARELGGEVQSGEAPFKPSWENLLQYGRVMQLTTAASEGASAMMGGGFDDLASTMTAGWQRLDSAPLNVAVDVRILGSGQAEGGGRLQLEAWPEGPQAPSLLTSAAVWMTSPEFAPESTGIVEVTGLVRVADPIVGSADPVLIFDSIGGEEAALRIREAKEWTRFRLLRVVNSGTPMRTTFALGGYGAAEFDAVRVRVIPLEPEGMMAARPGSKLR